MFLIFISDMKKFFFLILFVGPWPHYFLQKTASGKEGIKAHNKMFFLNQLGLFSSIKS